MLNNANTSQQGASPTKLEDLLLLALFCCQLISTFSPSPQTLQEEVRIPGTDVRLGYLSSRTSGYKSLLRITLTHSTIPFSLMKVHLMVAVEGRLFRKWFSAAPNLSYDFVWDKADVYSQKVYGLSEAFGEFGMKLLVFHFSRPLSVSSLATFPLHSC